MRADREFTWRTSRSKPRSSNPPRLERPGPVKHEWTVAKDGRLIPCEFRDEGEYGSEAQLLCEGEWYAGRRFGDRAHAVAHSDAVRARLARDGWTVTTQM